MIADKNLLHVVMNQHTERICHNSVGTREVKKKPNLTLRHVVAFLIYTHLRSLSLSSWSQRDLIESDFCLDRSDIGEMCQKQYLVYGVNAIDWYLCNIAVKHCPSPCVHISIARMACLSNVRFAARRLTVFSRIAHAHTHTHTCIQQQRVMAAMNVYDISE